MILQIEENKGVGLTVYLRNGLRTPDSGGQVAGDEQGTSADQRPALPKAKRVWEAGAAVLRPYKWCGREKSETTRIMG